LQDEVITLTFHKEHPFAGRNVYYFSNVIKESAMGYNVNLISFRFASAWFR